MTPRAKDRLSLFRGARKFFAKKHRDPQRPSAVNHGYELQRIRVAVQHWNHETGLRVRQSFRVAGNQDRRVGGLWGHMSARCRPGELLKLRDVRM
jgi:hypothetical protein